MTAGQMVWRVESLRCTAFLAPGWNVPKSTWQSMVGQDPESVNCMPRTGSVTEEGAFRDGQLQFSANPLRADWVYKTRIEPQVNNPDEFSFDGVGCWADVAGALDSVVCSWVQRVPDPIRLALGSILHIPTQNAAEAYRTLGVLLPDVKVPIEGASDFLFQINRPRMSRVLDGLQLNRLSKWSTARMQLRIQVAGSNKAMDLNPPLTACRLELDLSTPADREAPLQDVVGIWRELSQLGQEIAEKGDVP